MSSSTLKSAVVCTSRRGIGVDLEHRVLGRVIADGRVHDCREILQVPAVLMHADGGEQARGHVNPDLVRVVAFVPDPRLERHARRRRQVPLELFALERQVLARGEHCRLAVPGQRVRRRFAAALSPRLFGNNVPGHTTRVGFELPNKLYPVLCHYQLGQNIPTLGAAVRAGALHLAPDGHVPLEPAAGVKGWECCASWKSSRYWWGSVPGSSLARKWTRCGQRCSRRGRRTAVSAR